MISRFTGKKMATKALVIGGSAGSFQLVIRILEGFRPDLPIPVFLCLHRLKQASKGFEETLNYHASHPVREPYDKESICGGTIYLAPANYHMLVEKELTIALSTERPFNHSRPSIDVFFSSAADAYGPGLLAMLLSGANHDGTLGVAAVKRNGGTVVVQDPRDCEIRTMCESAIRVTPPDKLLTIPEIIEFVSLL
jgi:two-component system chemotaxis response regulator CheB